MGQSIFFRTDIFYKYYIIFIFSKKLAAHTGQHTDISVTGQLTNMSMRIQLVCNSTEIKVQKHNLDIRSGQKTSI